MIDSKEKNPFDELVDVKCITCSRPMKVIESFASKPECNNCYITKLEFLELEKKDED